ncbi:hypothetical protein [Verminephrobacter eiseniae]|nr:hypothetical protein [Verminephrobacter eiseniae]
MFLQRAPLSDAPQQATGNRQQATGNRQQAMGNGTGNAGRLGTTLGDRR